MTTKICNINTAKWEHGKDLHGRDWSHIDLSGDHLGVRIEELPPESTSSEHHYHTSEEEHVLILEGVATLIMGDDERELVEGDHVCFAAGVATAHHMVNRTNQNLKFLVFGERKEDDVVFYPEHQTMLIKSGNRAYYTYKQFDLPSEAET